jgi:spoIIIJ-associated protein
MANEALEVSGRSLEEALESAAEQLGVAADEVEYETVSEPRRIFGVIGSGQYTIRAWRKGAAPASAETAAFESAAVEEPEEGAPAKPSPQEVAQRAQEITSHIFQMMGMEAEVEIATANREGVSLEVKTPMSQGLLIGRHGDTLDALQFLVGVGANKGEHGGYRVTLDVGGYRKRQADKLRQMALETADQAVESGQEAVIPGLKPYERRIVHVTLAEREDVETYSEGEGEQRQIVISPKNLTP